MSPLVRLFGIAFVFVLACIAWITLGSSMGSRSYSSRSDLSTQVNGLWGTSQQQRPPELTFRWTTQRQETQDEQVNGKTKRVTSLVTDEHSRAAAINATTLDVQLDSDLRRKGLFWFSLYNAHVSADWSYTHNDDVAGDLDIGFAFPNSYGIYDDFQFIVDGRDYASTLTPRDGHVDLRIPTTPGHTTTIHVRYKTRGADSWSYMPGTGVGVLTNFKLTMRTDFADIDFPEQTLSPSDKARTADGWQLVWAFDQVVTGSGIGMVTPQRVQPGELAASMAFSAPVSLMFFFVVIFVIATIRKIDIHPINYLLIAAAFFAFHLLFAYTADRLPVEWAFGLSSVVSVVLVVSYMRLVVNGRFAFVEAAIAQLVYLVGFSLAHFAEGFTGLAITVMAILTLFLVMQLTGRIRFSEATKASGQNAAPSPIPHA